MLSRRLPTLTSLVLLLAACSGEASSVSSADNNDTSAVTFAATFHQLGGSAAFFDGATPFGGNGYRVYPDASGNAVAKLTEGAHTVMFASFSSHATDVSETFPFTVTAGGANEFTIDFITTRPTITACSDSTVQGQALYVTGATKYLGDWKKAWKMTPGAHEGATCWYWTGYAMPGSEFKIVRGSWTNDASIDTAQAEWEKGNNHSIGQQVLYNDNLQHPQF